MTRLEFDLRVDSDHPSLAGHFPGDPVVPGVLLIDRMQQALLRLTGRELVQLKQVKFTSALRPGEAARGLLDVDGARLSFRINAQRGDAVLGVAEGIGILSAKAPG
jgi:3-hydroxymyristoyl/3-hydroxydecanoyl-(acyl carrier protein) dehydratase